MTRNRLVIATKFSDIFDRERMLSQHNIARKLLFTSRLYINISKDNERNGEREFMCAKGE